MPQTSIVTDNGAQTLIAIAQWVRRADAPSHSDNETTKANARLIAAAPDLLAACQHVAAWFARLNAEQIRKTHGSLAEAIENWPTVGDDTGPLDLQPLLDAIAKADPPAPESR